MTLQMPAERKYGWELKPVSSSYFSLETKSNDQLNVVLNHALVRGCTSKMMLWWFQNFGNLQVRLVDVEGYEEEKVPAYFLWHPSDHIGAHYRGRLATDGTLQMGGSILVQEALQYKTHQFAHTVNQTMTVPYLAHDGMTLNKRLPIVGNVVFGRVHFKDVVENSQVIGVHYHYEFIAGPSSGNLFTPIIRRRLQQMFSDDLFSVWHQHNVEEVGTFENFLPALYAQRHDLDNLHYEKSMNPGLSSPTTQTGFSKELFESRVSGYKSARDGYEYQDGLAPTFI
ncbi:MAG: hypothetical protein AAF702_35040 [Chloroflexota bacterium]